MFSEVHNEQQSQTKYGWPLFGRKCTGKALIKPTDWINSSDKDMSTWRHT